MNDDRDSRLRVLFEAQRRDDASRAPSFAEMMARAKAAPPAPKSSVRVRRRLEWIGGLAAAAAIAALIVIPRVRSGDDAFEQAVRAFENDPALGAWQSPTDGLLSLPGDGLLSTIPSVGTVPQ